MAQPTQLNRDALGLTDVVFQGITHIGPALSVVFILPVIASRAGAAMPLSLFLSVAVCCFIANTVAQFARFLPSSGGYYVFVSHGLGPRFGLMTTWSYLIYDIRRLIEFASEYYTLYPGDVYYTGTPEGVGPVKAGDRLSGRSAPVLGELQIEVRA